MRMDGEAVVVCANVDWGADLKRPPAAHFCVRTTCANCEKNHHQYLDILPPLHQVRQARKEEDYSKINEEEDNGCLRVYLKSAEALCLADQCGDTQPDLALSGMSRFSVGCFLTAKKIKSFLQPTLITHARSKGITFVLIDHSRPLEEQGPFDAILHKVPSEGWHQQLQLYKQNHPEVFILDPPDAIKKVCNRQSMLQEVAAMNFRHPQGKVGLPKQLFIHGDPHSICDRVTRAGLKPPLVAKPLLIDGTENAHAISLVYSFAALLELRPPLVLQEFVNHGGVLFKVFVVGHLLKVVRRFSLPDIRVGEPLKSGIVPIPRVSCASASADATVLDPDAGELPPKEMLDALTRELQHRLGLSLINLDMIRENGKGKSYYIVDINYFPGYGKMPDYERVFVDYLLSLAEQKHK